MAEGDATDISSRLKKAFEDGDVETFDWICVDNSLTGSSIIAPATETLIIRCIQHEDERFLEHLLKGGIFTHQRHVRTGQLPVHVAITLGKCNYMRLVLQHSPCTAFAVCSEHWSCLHYACALGDVDTIRYLSRTAFQDENGLERRLNIDVTDKKMRTPLHIAAGCGKTDAVKLLLQYSREAEDGQLQRVSVNAAESSGRTPLHLSCIEGHVGVAKALVGVAQDMQEWAWRKSSPKADVNHFDLYGKTALHYAAQRGDDECADVLLRHGTDAAALAEPSHKVCVLLAAAVEDPRVMSCFAEYCVDNPQADCTRSLLGSLELVNISDLHSGRSRSASQSSHMSIRSDYFAEEASTSELASPLPDINESITSPDLSDASRDTPSPAARDAREFSIISNTIDPLSLSTFLHGATRQVTSSPLTHQQPVVMASSTLKSAAAQSQYIHFPKITALIEACAAGHEETVRILLRYGATDETRLGVKIALFAEAHNVVEALLTKCHKFEARAKTADTETDPVTVHEETKSAASISWSNLSLWDIDSSWLRAVEQLDREVHPIATSYRLQPQHTPCITLYNYPHLLQETLTSPSAIVHLELQNNMLSTVPLCVFQLEHLEALNLSSNQLRYLPRELRDTDGCENSVDNGLVDPAEKSEGYDVFDGWRCKKLAKLKLSNNSLMEMLPVCVWLLPALTVLEVQHSGLRSLPNFSELHSTAGVSVSPRLKILDLSDNMLDRIDGGLFYISSLENINLSCNHLSVLPSQMWMALSLKKLDLSRNRLARLPGLSLPFSELLSLDLNDIPSAYQEVYKQRMMYCEDRVPSGSLRSLPSSLVRIDPTDTAEKPEVLTVHSYSAEASLDLSMSLCHPVSTLKPVYQTTASPVWPREDSLTSQISCESDSESSPTVLKELNLSRNHFVGVPEMLACLAPRLTALNMSHNYLTSLGPIGNIPSGLKMLNLSNCRIRSCHIAPDVNIERYHCHLLAGSGSVPVDADSALCTHCQHITLPSLEHFVLDSNRLETFNVTCALTPTNRSPAPDGRPTKTPMEIVTKPLYPELRDLCLARNMLRQLSPLLGNQKNLKSLNIAHNKSLTHIPPELGKLRGILLNLESSGVNLIFPSPATHSPRRLPSFLSFLESTLRGSQEFRHMRLTIVGLSRRGKTTLLERLRGVSPMQLGPSEPTVSIDMLDVELQPPKPSHASSHDAKKPIIFNCWDFAGEELYYSLHQCFIFQRTLFLVVWKLTDGEKGIDELEQWLVNIQSRAPDSPVLIVGTHLDELPNSNRKARVEELLNMVTSRYQSQPPKPYLPKVVGISAVSSTARRHHCIDDLKALLYDIASNLELKQHGGIEYTSRHEQSANLLLCQPVPASYLKLRQRILEAASDRYRAEKSVLTKEKFRQEFRDCLNDEDEFTQAVAFCHHQGLILHYEEAALQRLYFLDPSWLCKVMARIISPEGGPRCRGLLSMADLRENLQHSNTLVSYILHLLEKFEVVLRLSDDLCLVQSQLESYLESPGNGRMSPLLGYPGQSKSRSRSVSRSGNGESLSSYQSKFSSSTPSLMSVGATPQAVKSSRNMHVSNLSQSGDFEESFEQSVSSILSSSSDTLSPDRRVSSDSFIESISENPNELRSSLDVTKQHALPSLSDPAYTASAPIRINTLHCLHRLWIMECFPSGFWPRLLSRVVRGALSTDILSYHLPLCDLTQFKLEALVDARGNATGVHHGPLCWYSWSDRLELKWQDCVLMRLTLTTPASSQNNTDQSDLTDSTKPNSSARYIQCDAYGQYAGIIGSVRSSLELEIFIDIWSSFANAYSSEGSGWQRAFSQPMWDGDEHADVGFRIASSWLAHITQTVCVLVGDWFHGVVRDGQMHCVLPCHMCLEGHPAHPETIALFRAGQGSHRRAGQAHGRDGLLDESVRPDEPIVSGRQNSRECDDMLAVHLDPNSIVCFDLSSLVYLMQQCDPNNGAGIGSLGGNMDDFVQRGLVQCPKHGFFLATDSAPDLAFEDVTRSQLLSVSSSRNVQTDKMMLGFGGQGVIFRGRLRQGDESMRAVALKFFHWDAKEVKKKTRRGPIDLRSLVAERAEDAWVSYEALRQEVNMLLCLSHEHIMSMVGVSSSPHCVVLDLAPLGNLRVVYDAYRKSGIRLGNFTTRQLAYQVASALAYIHERSIIYRDMKSDNVLAFSFPAPSCHHDVYYNLVHVKLTDHGISRMGGQAMRVDGTARFIAPEVLTHYGNEPYGPKVDVFAYGMFLYELISMEKPFSSYHDARANAAVLRDQRPGWTPKLGHAPVCAQDVMLKCWMQDPDLRPTMSEVLTMIKMPTFARILNALYFEECFTILDACVSVIKPDADLENRDKKDKEAANSTTTEIWVVGGSRECGVAAVLNLETYKMWHYKVCDNRVTCVGSVGSTVWIGTSAGYLCIYDVLSRQRLFYGIISVGRYALQITHCPNSHCVLVAVSDKTLRAYRDELQFSPGQDEGMLETMSAAFMPNRWSICCFTPVPNPAAKSLVEAQRSQRLEVWCGLDCGRIMVFDADCERWAQEKQSQSGYQVPPSPTPESAEPSPGISQEEEGPSLLQEKESLQLPFHDNQPCSFVCVTQFQEDQISGDEGAPMLRTRVWLAVRRRSVVSCWTYGSVCWSPFDMSVYLRSSEGTLHVMCCVTIFYTCSRCYQSSADVAGAGYLVNSTFFQPLLIAIDCE
eukprot:scpid2508/ scgid0311/ Leucine-rich repeat serine/threonine-protein kinase 1; Leucine-rich repeats, ras-like domain, kinase protein 1; PARK8-related kinase